MPTTILLITVAGAGTGCFASDDLMTEDEFCQEYAKRECLGVAAFCGFTLEGCQPVRAQVCRERSAASKSASRPYVAANATACLDKVRDAYGKPPILPETLRALNEACARVFQGSAKATQTCTVDYDCEKQLICDKGRCGARKEVATGAGCANIGEVCPRGEYCKRLPELTLCSRRQDKGMPCGPAEPCLESYRCVETCQDRVRSGAACLGDGDCESGYCDPFARFCAPGLSFAPGSNSCRAFAGETADAGATD